MRNHDFAVSRIIGVTHFLRQLTLFTARLSRTYALFLLGVLRLLLVNTQRFYFLLRLTFFFATATIALATRLWLLLVAGLRFLCYLSSLLAVVAIGALLRLSAVTAIFITAFTAFSTFATVIAAVTTLAALVTVIAIAVVVLTLTAILLAFRFFRRFRRRLLGRFGLFATAEQRFQRAKETA